MFFKNVIYALLIALGFVGWGIIGNYSKASGCWIAMGVNLATTVTLLGIYFGQIFSGLPNRFGIILLAFSGVINGLSVWLYSSRLADPALSKVEVGVFIATVWVAMIIMTPILNFALNRVWPTPNHAIGLVLAIAALYFLNR